MNRTKLFAYEKQLIFTVHRDMKTWEKTERNNIYMKILIHQKNLQTIWYNWFGNTYSKILPVPINWWINTNCSIERSDFQNAWATMFPESEFSVVAFSNQILNCCFVFVYSCLGVCLLRAGKHILIIVSFGTFFSKRFRKLHMENLTIASSPC